jgi:imidazole glycerol phosphate synthase subunit HisF
MIIEKSTQIARPMTEVFAYLKQTKNQDNFSVWNMTDPSMNKKYLGKDGTVGFIYCWDSANKNVGAGEQEITVIEEGKMIGYEVRFFKPMKNTGKVSFLFSRGGNGGTLVTWIFDSPSKFPFSLFAPIFKRMLGKDLEKGLANLKGILENPE